MCQKSQRERGGMVGRVREKREVERQREGSDYREIRMVERREWLTKGEG